MIRSVNDIKIQFNKNKEARCNAFHGNHCTPTKKDFLNIKGIVASIGKGCDVKYGRGRLGSYSIFLTGSEVEKWRKIGKYTEWGTKIPFKSKVGNICYFSALKRK